MQILNQVIPTDDNVAKWFIFIYLLLVTKTITVFVEELNNVLLVSLLHILEISTYKYVCLNPDQIPLFILAKARDYSRWGRGLSLKTNSQKREPLTHSHPPQPANDSSDAFGQSPENLSPFLHLGSGAHTHLMQRPRW